MSDSQPTIYYDYASVPTIRDFSRSDEFLRGLMGPFGSGKSSGCVVEIYRRANTQKQSPDGVRRTRWAVIRNCYDDQTEILTERRGWQFFRDLRPDDKVAMLQDERMVFVQPTHYFAEHYEGPMVQCDSRGLNFCVTPDHKLYASRINGRTKERAPYEFHFARDVVGKTNYEFRVAAPCEEVYLPRYSPTLFELLGFHYAEGWCQLRGGRYSWVFTQNDPGYVSGLLDKLGWEHSVNQKPLNAWGGSGCAIRVSIPRNGDPRSATIKELIRKLQGQTAKTKALPEWIKQAPPEFLERFLRGFEEGDGHTRTGKNDSTRLYTASPQLADDLQEIALRAGKVATVTQNGNGLSQVTLLTDTRSAPCPRKTNWSEPQYSGMVYCVEVPTHIILVRRQGRAVWCSQTYQQLRDTSIKTFLDWFPEQHFGTFKHAEHIFKFDKIKGLDCEVMFRALDRPDQMANLLSMELTGAWVNEAREVPWAIIQALIGRVGRYPSASMGGASWRGIFMDTNPPDDDSWWYKLFEVEKPPNARIYRQPSGVSPDAENMPHLPGDYYENMLMSMDAEAAKVYVHGEYGYVRDGRPVYSEYVDSTHCRECEPVPGSPIHRGWDFGLTPACIFSQLLPSGQWIVFDELVAEELGVENFSERVLDYSIGNYPDFSFEDEGDPAGMQRAQTDERSCFDILHAKGIEIVGGEQTLTMRLESVKKALTTMVDGKPGFQLDPRCKKLRKGFNGRYQFRRLQTSDERFTEKPDKNEYSHPHDALQYTGTRLFGSRLLRIVQGTERARYEPRNKRGRASFVLR